MSRQQNLVRIKVVYDALEELAEKVVFVGGATVALYTDRPGDEVRPTDDVDILIELAHYKGYGEIEEKLRKKGFANEAESGVICRYKVRGVVVDIMPTSDGVLGFANRWYVDGFTNAIDYDLAVGYQIRIFSPAFFLATKLEAFANRGRGDGRTSTDFEDIVYVLNNRSNIWDELNGSQQPVRQFLIDSFRGLLENRYVDEWISAHLEYRDKERQYFIIGNLQEFIDMSN